MKKLFLLVFLLTSVINSQTLVGTVNLPSGTYWNSAYGMVYENGKYWISSGSSAAGLGLMNAVDSTGTQVATINITYPGMQESQGLAFDGINFWYVDIRPAGNIRQMPSMQG